MTSDGQPQAFVGDERSMRGRRVALLLCCLAQLMVTLDSSILAVALPALRTELGFTASTLPWVVNAFAIPIAGLLLFSGRLSDRFGSRTVLGVGVIVFALASLGAGLAPTAAALLTGRVGQGVGAALMATSCLALLSQTFPDGRNRARAFGLWGAASGSGGAIGVLGGGVIVETWGWRWTLLVNVPIGLVLFALLVLGVRAAAPTARPRLDLGGSATFAIAAVTLVLAVMSFSSESPATAWGWSSVGVVSLAAFVLIETRLATSPLVPFFTLRSSGAWRPIVAMLFVGGAMTAAFYFLTLNLQLFHELGPLSAGLAFLPLSLGAFLAAGSSHLLQARLGTARTMALGALVMTLGLTATWLVSGSQGPVALVMASGVFGIGMGVTLASIADGTTQLISPALAGVALGVLTTAQQFGNSFGLAVVAVADDRIPSPHFQTGFASTALLALVALGLLCLHARQTRESV